MAVLFDGSANFDHYSFSSASHPQTNNFSCKFVLRARSWQVSSSGGIGNLFQNWFEGTSGADVILVGNDASGIISLVKVVGGTPTQVSMSTALELNRNYEFLLSYTANTVNGAKLYIDGVLALQLDTPAAIGYDDFFFGGTSGATPQASDAYWFPFSYWSVALTAGEAAAEFGHASAQKTANLWDTWNPPGYQAVTYVGAVNGHSLTNQSTGDTYVADDMVPTLLRYGATGTIAYSSSGGATVAPTYPSGITNASALVLIVGQKPATANGGGVTTPTGWTLQGSLTGANDGDTGGYTSTLGADTGNVNLFVYTKDVVLGTESGTLSISLTDNNVAFANIYRVQPVSPVSYTYAGAAGKDTSAGNVSIVTGNMNIAAADMLFAAMAIPTDVTTPAQFSAETLAQTGTVFGTLNEIEEPDTTTGNQIGGFVAYGYASSGGGAGAATLTATAGGTTTNVKGPGIVLRLRYGAPVAAPNYPLAPPQFNRRHLSRRAA